MPSHSVDSQFAPCIKGGSVYHDPQPTFVEPLYDPVLIKMYQAGDAQRWFTCSRCGCFGVSVKPKSEKSLKHSTSNRVYWSYNSKVPPAGPDIVKQWNRVATYSNGYEKARSLASNRT